MPIDANLAIFCAALQGYIAGHNHSEYGPVLGEQAVDYARMVVRAAYDNDPKRTIPDLVGKAPANAE